MGVSVTKVAGPLFFVQWRCNLSASEWIWMNGRLDRHGNAQVHVGSTAMHFGPVVFEGIRCYDLGEGRRNFFRLEDHIGRFQASARDVHLQIPFSSEELTRACMELVEANRQSDAYLRLLAFPGTGTLGFGRPRGPAETFAMSFPWDNAHLVRSQRKGISIRVSSVIRSEAHPIVSKAKISANYVAGLLAIREAHAAGCDDAFLLDRNGAVSEASTANIFAVWGERLVTPPAHLPILPGITRHTLLVLARELGIEASEALFTTDDLATADEIFIAGTTAEITPVREVNGRKPGAGVSGPITTRLHTALQAAIRAESPAARWSPSTDRV